jgi:hypothetical protein
MLLAAVVGVKAVAEEVLEDRLGCGKLLHAHAGVEEMHVGGRDDLGDAKDLLEALQGHVLLLAARDARRGSGG